MWLFTCDPLVCAQLFAWLCNGLCLCDCVHVLLCVTCWCDCVLFATGSMCVWCVCLVSVYACEFCLLIVWKSCVWDNFMFVDMWWMIHVRPKCKHLCFLDFQTWVCMWVCEIVCIRRSITDYEGGLSLKRSEALWTAIINSNLYLSCMCVCLSNESCWVTSWDDFSK